MNKQQLAAKIWDAANKMRSKIEANEYKDYILGFIFYKFISDKEVEYAKELGYTEEDLETALVESDPEVVESFQKNIGYFIAYQNLFSTWISQGTNFDSGSVPDALNAFTRNISKTHKNVFGPANRNQPNGSILSSLQTGLSKLGDTSSARTRAISSLIHLIDEIPMDDRQGYDVLGYIYEYLIGQFASNAGKKAGEFYTPHEVSLLMSEIVAAHLGSRDKIEIYDPTSGSGSLLINIGKCAARYMSNKNAITYYAQELKENTYNLTRMNLVMRGISPDNIVPRNADTLEADWPWFDENDPANSYKPLYVDAVVSNPPYSQHWNPVGKDADIRFKDFGLAPKGKADYAFLLHDLSHLKPDGVMTIVLPHGVLFRGGEEGKIREKLIERAHIDVIIGLPANIFFGTGIPTIIMVLRQTRPNTDVLIIDASKGFEKAGTSNRLRACDIKRITDAIAARTDIPGYARVVSRDEIRANDYNLNIPRYVDSNEKAESWDIYASMFGGVPAREAEAFSAEWKAFPGLKETLFADTDAAYWHVKTDSIREAVQKHESVAAFRASVAERLRGFDARLREQLVEHNQSAPVVKCESEISAKLFARLDDVPLIDRYDAYQILDGHWNSIATDLEILQTEGWDAVRIVEPHMVVKKKDGKEIEEQDGWQGRVLPFDLVQRELLMGYLTEVNLLEQKQNEITSELEEQITRLSEEQKLYLLNEDNSAFVAKQVNMALEDILDDVKNEEIKQLECYRSLTRKKDKLTFMSVHPEICWDKIDKNKDGTCSQGGLSSYTRRLKLAKPFPENSFESLLVKTASLLDEEKKLKKELKDRAEKLHLLTKATIEKLSDSQACDLLDRKWIVPLCAELEEMPGHIVANFAARLEKLAKKYSFTLSDTDSQIKEAESELCSMLGKLTGDEHDMAGIAELRRLLGGAADD